MRQAFGSIVAAVLVLAGAAATPAPERLVYHEVRTDATGAIVPWFDARPSVAYDHVIRLAWQFWRRMRTCPNGVHYYMQHQVWTPDTDDPRGLGGDQLAMALSSWNLLHAYLGDEAIVQNMRDIADYYLAHGLSPATAAWGNLPYPYNTDVHSGVYDGDMRAGRGFLQPDKAASFGYELVTLYRITAEPRYLHAAVKIADTLARHATAGTADEGPWPYRVHAERPDAQPSAAGVWTRYTANWTGALELFDGLVSLGAGDAAAYRRAHDLASAWLGRYPMRTNNWGPFFEDITEYSNTAINAGTMVRYLLDHPSWDPDWKRDARAILDWTEDTFRSDEFLRFRVTPINEQTAYRVPGNSHTSRHASMELRYASLTGDWSRKEMNVRRLNWATYMVDDDGKNRYLRDDVWLTDGYGDYVRHYLRAMAAAPDLAPDDQNHLLETSSVIRTIEYGADRIRYAKADARSTERLKLGSWAPGQVTGGTLRWDPAARVADVSATAATVVIERAREDGGESVREP